MSELRKSQVERQTQKLVLQELQARDNQKFLDNLWYSQHTYADMQTSG